MNSRAMYSSMMKLVNATDNLYLSPTEQRQLLGYAESLPGRFQAARVVEARETELSLACVDRVRRLYPRFESYHTDAWDKGYRDVQLVLRYTVQAMLMDDPEVATDKLLGWLRTLLAGLGMTPRLMQDTFGALRDVCREKLPADVFTLLEPCLNRNVEVLSDIPEPAVAAV